MFVKQLDHFSMLNESQQPLVSIGVASYNNSKYIIETLDSINNQLYENIEIIIVDDCSKDDSLQVINNWLPLSKFPARLIANKVNNGLTKVCNIIYKNLDPKTSFLAIIGSDDVMLPERILNQVNLHFAHKNVAAVFSDMLIINERGETINSSYYSSISEDYDSINKTLVQETNQKVESIINKNVIPAPSVLYNKTAVEKIGGWDESLNFEDWDFNLRLLREGYNFIPSADCLIKYRKLPHSLSGKPTSTSFESLLKFVSKHRNITPDIDKAIDNKIIECAHIIYQYGGKTSVKWLVQRFKLTRDLKTFAFLTCAFLKIPYSTIQKFK